MRNTPSCTHIKIMKKEITTENIKMTLDSTKDSTSIKVNFKPKNIFSNMFPDITRFENYTIINKICPLQNLTLKDTYSDNELVMITNFLAYTYAMGDLTFNKIGTYDSGVLTQESDFSYTYTLCMPTINNETAYEWVKTIKETRKYVLSKKIKNGIQHKKNKEACKHGR